MDSKRLINAQFDRAVEIVQGLPKTGPIQTGYEEKLTMYSLYKQATVGNVTTERPSVWDMLGRAKWDEWAKHKDLDPYEAKSMYVDALLKVLRKYPGKTVARKLVEELESYRGGPAKTGPSRSSSSSGSTSTDEPELPSTHPPIPPDTQNPPDTAEMTSEDETDDDAVELVPREPTRATRPQSSLSSRRYRTPMADSLAMSPPPIHTTVPATQPLPRFETPSAFAEPPSPSLPTSSAYVEQFPESSRTELSPSDIYHSRYRGQTQPLPSRQYGPGRPISQPTLERTIESVQGHLAALTERLELLEANAGHLHRSNPSLVTVGSSPNRCGAGRGSPADRRDFPEWDLDDLGMWSLVLNPLSRGFAFLRDLAALFVRNSNGSPTFIVVRRLCLDISFLLCVLAVVRTIWRKSGVRRREVRAALVVLWRALLGTKERTMVDRGV